MAFASGFSWFHLIPAIGHDSLLASFGIHEHTHLVVTAWSVCAFLVATAVVARMGLERAKAKTGLERYFADSGLSVRNVFEVFTGAFLDLMSGMMGKHEARRYFPFVGSLFAYILTCNLLGIFPGLLPPTDNINTNVGMALVVFLVFNGTGLIRDPVGYIKHLMGPVLLMAPLILPIEIFGLVLRPMTLSVRLTANLYGDHMVFGSISSMMPWFVPVPAVLIAYAIFVSFIQAFVFSLLSTIYITLALPHHEGGDHAHH
jgi:F-type H+-transporting ATPase subunit a